MFGVGLVSKEDIVKGYEVFKGDYVLIEDAEIEVVKIESCKMFELV